MEEVQTIQKNIHMPARKLRLVADMVRKMKPVTALLTLRFVNKAAALPLTKSIKTVLANAKQQGFGEDEMIFKTLEINEGFRMKRFRAAGRGNRRPYVKGTSHIRIIVQHQHEDHTDHEQPQPEVKIEDKKLDKGRRQKSTKK